MNGKHALIWLGLAGVAGAVLFETSYDVQEMEERLVSLNRQIVHEQEAIQVLRAEWSFLNDPTRLESLARAHTELRPAEARQFVALDVVPFRPTPTVTEPLPSAPSLHSVPNVASAPRPNRVPPVPASALATVASAGNVPAAAMVTPASVTPASVTPASVSAAGAAPARVAPASAAATPAAVAKPPSAAKPQPGGRPVPSRPVETIPAKLTAPSAPAPRTAPSPNDAMGVLIARLGGNQ